ncbi:uncharacterized protein LOC124952673 isoform X2 [Vespa velutina]|uniref:uncharacterized protein LOC124952673 isoform X2 n=1 Tax=Vespa velutina TaxID=202808 RepID=UPI001FB329C0|nr:uncharacterized protein LOC124952673 isoform X2 [Vespa velutina]
MKFEVPVHRKKYFIFRAKDYCSLMRPCFVISCILGVFPYKATPTSMSMSKFGYLYSTLVTGLYVVHVFVVLYQTDVSSVVKYDSVPGILQVNFYFILGTAVVVTAYYNLRHRLLFLQQLYLVASKLPSETFNKLSKYIHAKDIIGFFFLVGQMPNVLNRSLALTFTKCSLLYVTLTVFIMDMLYMNCTCIINECFKRINKNLENLQHVVVTGEPHLLRRVYHEKKNPLLLMELKAIKRRHQEVSDVLQQLNSTFGSQIIITSLMTFAELGLIAWTCETAKNQAAEVGIRIHEVVINTKDKDIKNELQLFSLQVLHRDNTFTSKGLTMDASLLTTIVGSITTYLLILIQFLISLRSCKSNNATNVMF